MSRNSIIALDEPCKRITGNDGTSIAVSICIQLLDSESFTFCTTHDGYLTRISDIFLNVTK